MADTRPIYEGPVGNTGLQMIIHPIADNMNRGILTIYNRDEEVQFQKEVPVTRMEPLGGTPKDMAHWHKVVTTWFHNNY